MAEIDKSLPNEVRNSIEIAGPVQEPWLKNKLIFKKSSLIQGPRKLHH
jgi:hypothetical protein